MNTSADEDKPNNALPDGSANDAARSLKLPGHRIDSRDLFVGTREITIQHGEDSYRLRLTAQNKLILTK